VLAQKRAFLIVGLLIFDQVEVLDVAGPFEVFSVTRLHERSRREEPSPFRVLLVSEKKEPVVAVGGLRLLSDVSTQECPDLNLLIIPGGFGTRREIENKKLIGWIAERASKTDLTASVCTGSSLLGKAGLLDGHEATTHWLAFDFLRRCAPKAKILSNVRYTLQQPIFTSAGVSSGIDLALRIVSHYFGNDVGVATARYMEYPYPFDNRRA
jgi:transcriptional regulator GlxA family with amidase domain